MKSGYIFLIAMISGLLFLGIIAQAEPCTNCGDNQTVDESGKITISYSSDGIYYNDVTHIMKIQPDSQLGDGPLVFYNVSFSQYEQVKTHNGVLFYQNVEFYYHHNNAGYCVLDGINVMDGSNVIALIVALLIGLGIGLFAGLVLG
jgi:hypothetical protein